MKTRRVLAFVAAAIAAGIATPYVVPDEWFKYILGTCGVIGFVFVSLAGASAKRGAVPPLAAIVLRNVVGTDSPTARVEDNDALNLLWLTIAYAAGFTIGAFSAVHV